MQTALAPLPETPPARPQRRRRLLGVGIVLLVAAVVAGLLWGTLRPGPAGSAGSGYLGTDGWPATGQGAYRLGNADALISPGQRPVPIASVAKVMTAYVVLQKWPLRPGEQGPSSGVTADDVRDTDQRRAAGESVVPVAAGERLTEHQALMALLLPSANNVALMLGRWVCGSDTAFVAEMNRAAAALGMTQTTYTDPSGLAASTVSTAADQLRLAEVVAKDPVLAGVMRTRTFRLPYAGIIRNTDVLLGTGGFVGMKTGSHQAAGGCFMFHALRKRADGTTVSLVGVVLGQPARPGVELSRAGQLAALALAERITPGPEPAETALPAPDGMPLAGIRNG